MDIKKEMQKFNKRWNITKMSSHIQEFQDFTNRLANSELFKNVDYYCGANAEHEFCQIMGIRKEYMGMISFTLKESMKNDLSLFECLQLIFFLLEISAKEIFFAELEKILYVSNVNLSIAQKEGEVVLYPCGEKQLDDILVDQTLQFLNPESNQHFFDALQFYQKKRFIKSAESLRRSLEEFLRKKLNNNNGLQTNLNPLRQQLKSDGRDPQVRNIISSVFTYLDKYFNENSKHQDGDIDETENEFLIYQTATLMRYIDKAVK